ncbi:FG-GAP-like repeat-containing protein [Dyadobacter bucti]|uniref:FG-GAP-like repeat-containing protein n=1 Tax=Dyadobacter bucti TaxID=2572203 RepID=UPI001E39FB6C|nr:FG-GAP-like repeat-containing protein [Dyadobacter bucti]
MTHRYFSWSYASMLLLSFCISFVADAQLADYSAIYTNANFSKTIDLARPVGSIPASANVILGAATYSIPINVPPGTNGIAPSISLEYNSMGGGGLIGMGWGISGLSVISRIPLTVYHDGAAGAVELNTNMRFALDGNRMMLASGNNGGNGATYQTENETFASITSYSGGLPSVPGWFKVVSKDGVVMEYGNTADSKLRGNNFSDGNIFLADYALFWRLNKIQYPDGNYIEFKYDNTLGECLVTEIDYTGNAAANLVPYNKIKFEYKKRIDSNVQLEAGSSIGGDHLLDKITITTESLAQTCGTYQFKYASDDINSFLKEIIQSGSDGSVLNSTIFKYGELPLPFSPSQSDVVQGEESDRFIGDFNGDGHADFLSVARKVQGQHVYHTKFSIYTKELTFLGSPDNYYLGGLKNLPLNNSFVKPFYIPQATKWVASDFTGDGADDILAYNAPVAGANRVLNKVVIYKSVQNPDWQTDGTGFPILLDSVFINPPANYNKLHPSDRSIFAADLNGDGVQDILTMLGNNANAFAAHLYYGNVSAALETVSINGVSFFNINSWPAADQIQFLDFNGDGKGDLMVIKDNNCEIFTFEGLTARRIYFSTFPTKNHLIYPGDFNGDGKTDLLVRNSVGGLWAKALSSGKSFWQSGFTFQHTPNPDLFTGDQLAVADFNGDGRSDIYHGWQQSAALANIDMYYSPGSGYKHIQSQFAGSLGAPPPAMGDMNGDGRMDIVNTTSYLDELDFFYFKKEGKELLLEKVAIGTGHVTEWNYKKLTDAGDFYKQGGLTSYPVNNIQKPIYAVADFKLQNGIGGYSQSQYRYEEAKLHRAGKGFMGFKKITLADLASGMTTVSENEFSGTFYVAAPKKTSNYLTAGNMLLSEITNTNEFISLGGKRFLYRLKSTSENNVFEGRTATLVNDTFDNFGNVTKSKANNNNIETTVTSTVFGAFPAGVPNKPTSVTVTTTRTGQPAFSTVTSYGYNPLGQLTSKTDFSGQPKSVTTGYEYFPLGNLKKTTVTPSGMAARSTSAIYDPKGRLPVSTTNELGQTASVTYDYKWGKPLTVTGIDALTTTYEYDAFGRTKKTILPQGYNFTEAYGWDLANGAVWYKLLTHPGKPDVKTWYDLLDREIKTQTEAFPSGWITQSRTYDARGNAATATQPYKTGEAVLTTTTQYDNYNRPSVISNSGPFGTTTIGYAYSGGKLTTTTSTPAGNSSKTTDATGQVTSASDDGGTLTYTYYSHGGLKEVKDDQKTITSSEYDVYGRQTKLIDQNAGATTYDYDALGQLVSQTNANNKTHTLTYDLLGRNTGRSGPEGNTVYEYYPAGSGAAVNQLKKVTGFAGNLEEYTYDNFGRLKTTKETVDAVAYTTTYGYDNYNNVTSVLYPSGFGTNHAFDANGYPVTIKNANNSVTLYTNTGMNGLGLNTAYTLGNGKTSTINYNYGTPTQYTTAGVQNLELIWDYPKGNLTKRKDGIKNKEESFAYDNLNRLLSATVTGKAPFTVTYTPSGNISSKSDAGQTFTYHPTKSNALTGIVSPTTAIPILTQDITYTAFNQPEKITENGSGQPYELTYTYGADYQRLKGVMKKNGALINTHYYLSGSYEKDVTPGLADKHIHYIGSPAGLTAMVIRENNVDQFYYTYTDHLGSLLTLTAANGTVLLDQNFDAWGRLRNPADWTFVNVPAPTSYLYRGFTGHEHLTNFNLINMNGRMYDPVVGRVLSVDNYVQDPYSTQSYNRYSYVMNNPLKYTDPSGATWKSKFENWISEQNPLLRSTVFLPTLIMLNPAVGVIDATTLGGFSTGFAQRGFEGGTNKVKNFLQILGGQFAGDGGQIASRHLSEPLQNSFGLGFGIFYNNIDPDLDVDYFEGATVVRGSTIFDRDAVTIGSHIFGNRNDITKPFLGNNLLLHEYGHYLQSKENGPIWINKYGLPSLISAAGSGDHDDLWVEQDANRRSFEHFGTRTRISAGWDFINFPLGNIKAKKWTDLFRFIFDPLAISRYYK